MLSQELILQFQSLIERRCGKHIELDVARKTLEAYTRFYEVLIKMDKESKEQKENINNENDDEPTEAKQPNA